MKRVNSTLHFALFCFASFFSTFMYAQVQKPVYESMSPDTKGYYEYLPQGYDPNGSETYPLLLFVHGTGEYGYGKTGDLPLVLRNGPPRLINDGVFPESFTVRGKTFKFIVISPQFIHWPSNADIDVILNYLIAKYKVDTKRIYFTGLSMGGGVVWNYAGGSATYAKRLAAIATVCGASYPAVGRINVIAAANLPVWAFHNAGDPTVSPTWTVGYVDGLNDAGIDPPAKKTIFQGGGHDAWTKAYNPDYKENGMNVFEWMLQYSKDGNDNGNDDGNGNDNGGGDDNGNGGGDSDPTPVPNKAPVVDAGKGVTITLPANSVSLTGASASDSDGSIASYRWTRVYGPYQFTFSSTLVLNPTISNLKAGVYKFRLTVTDDDGSSAYDDIIVNVVSPVSDGSPKTINVNVNEDDNTYNDDEWNNWVIDNEEESGISSGNLKYSDGSSSTVGATLSYSLKMTDNSENYIDGMAPAEVLRYASCSDDARTLTITGLSQDKTYSIDIYASRSIRNNASIFTIGKTSEKVTTYYNATSDALFEDLVPDNNGTITIIVRSGTRYNYINGFTITESGASDARKAIIAKSNADLQLIKSSPNALLPSFNIYPNPVNDKFMVQLNNEHTGNTNVRVIDISGKVRKNISFKKDYTLGSLEVYAKDLPAGTYMVQVQTGNFSDTKKIVKL